MKYYNYPDPRGTEVAEDVDSKNISQYGGGGGNVLHVVIGADKDDNPICDHSFSEVFNALERKDLVIFTTSIIKGRGAGDYAASCDYDDNSIVVKFIVVDIDQNDCMIAETEYIIRSDNTIEVDWHDLTLSGTPVE